MSNPLTPSFVKKVPDDDTYERSVCDHCGFIHYRNPFIIVGSVVRHGGQYLLCRRAIEPRKGFWTIPAGFLEMAETPQEGARREAREEANADLDISALLAVYTVRHLSQVQLIYRASLAVPEFSAGVESLEVQLFDWDNIPFEHIAFPSVHWALHHERAVERGEAVPPQTNPQGSSGFIKA